MLKKYTALLTEVKKVLEKEGLKALLVEVSNPGVVWLAQGQVEKLSELFAVFLNDPTEELSDDKSSPVLQTSELSQILQALINFRAVFAKCHQGAKFTNTQLVDKKVTQTRVGIQSASIQGNLDSLLTAIQDNLTQAYRTQLFQFDTTKAQDTQLTQLATDIQQLFQGQLRLSKIQQQSLFTPESLLESFLADISATSAEQKTAVLQALRLKLNPPITLTTRVQAVTSKPVDEAALKILEATALKLLSETTVVNDDATRKMLGWLNNSSDSAEIKKDDIATHFAKVNWVPALDNAHLPQTLDKLIILKDKLSLAKTLANGEVADEIDVILTSIQKKFDSRVDALLSEIPAETSDIEKTILLQELRLKLNPSPTLVARFQVAIARSSNKTAVDPVLDKLQQTALTLLTESAIVANDATRQMLAWLNDNYSAETTKEDIATHFAKVNWVLVLDDAHLPQHLNDLIILKGKLSAVKKLASSEVVHEIDIILASIQKKFNALHAGIVHQCEQTLPEEPQHLLVLKADLLKLKQHDAVQTTKNQTDNTLQKLQDKLDEHYVNQIITICDTDLSATAFSDITAKYSEVAQLDVLLKKLATTLGKNPAHLRQLLKKLQAVTKQSSELAEASMTNTTQTVSIIEKITKVLVEERHKVDPIYLLFAGLQQNRLDIAASAVTNAVSNVISRWKKSPQPIVAANPLLPYLEQISEWDDTLDNELLPTELDKLLSLKQNLLALKVTNVESKSAEIQKIVLQKSQTKIDQIQFAKLQTILVAIKAQFIGDDSIGQQESLAKLTQSINLPAELLPLLDDIAKQHSKENLQSLLTEWANALNGGLGTSLNLYRTLRLIQTLALSKMPAQLTPTAATPESIGGMSVINTLIQTLSGQQEIKPALDQYYRDRLTAILMMLTYKELMEFVTVNAQRTSVFGGPSVIQKTPVLLTAFLQAVDELARENLDKSSLKTWLDSWIEMLMSEPDALNVYRTLRLLQITQQMPQTTNVKPDSVVMPVIASMVLKLQEKFVEANSVEWLFAELAILIATAKVDENYHQIGVLLAKFANNEDLLASCDVVLANLITQDNVANFSTDLIKKLDLIAEIVHDEQSKDSVAKIKDKIEARKKAVFGILISGTIAVEPGVGNTNGGANGDVNGNVTSLLDCHKDSGDKAKQPTDGDNMSITLEETDLSEAAAFLLLVQLECLDENLDKDIQKLIGNLSGFDILAEVNSRLVNSELIATQLKKLITTEESANQVIANLVLINQIVKNKHKNFVNPINPIFDNYRHIKVDDNYTNRIVINIGAIQAKVQEHKTLLAQNQFLVSQPSSTAQLSDPLLQQHRTEPTRRTKGGNGGSSLSADTEAPIGRTFGTSTRSSSFIFVSSANSTSSSANAEFDQVAAIQEIFSRIHAELLVRINATLAISGFFTSPTGEPVTKLDLTGDTISLLLDNLQNITVVARSADADSNKIRRQYPMLHASFSELAKQKETFRKELVLFEMIHDAIAVLKQLPTSDTLAKIKEQFFVTSTFDKKMSEDLIMRHFIRAEDIDDIENSDSQSVQRPSLSARLSATGLSREFVLINSNLCKILLKHNESDEFDVQVLMNKAIRHLKVTTDAHLVYAKSILRGEFKKQATSKDEVNEVKQTLDNGDNDSLIRQIQSRDNFNLQTINKASSSLEIATAKLYATLKLAEILEPLTLEKSSTERAVGLANYYAKLEEYRPIFNLNRDTFIQRFLRAINYYLGFGFLQEKNKVSDLTFFGQPKGGQFAQKAAKLVGIPEPGFQNWPIFPWQRPAPPVA